MAGQGRALAAVLLMTVATPGAGAGDVRAPSADARRGKLLLFNIPAMPLHQALERFSAVTGSAVMYNSHLAESRQSSPVIGLFTPEVALRMLLESTDLTIRYTSSTDFMLISLAEVRAEQERDAANGGGAQGTLALDTLYVDVPPGSEKRPDFAFYGQAVRAELKRALARDPDTANRIYQVQVDIWISHTGQLRFPRLVKSTGRPHLDDTIRHVIETTTLQELPPTGMPQPLRLTIIAF